MQSILLEASLVLVHGAMHNDCKVDLEYIDSEQIEREGVERLLSSVDAVLVPGGFGDRGTEGKIPAIEYARLNRIPFFGICLGMQLAVVEFRATSPRMLVPQSARVMLPWGTGNFPKPILGKAGAELRALTRRWVDRDYIFRTGWPECVVHGLDRTAPLRDPPGRIAIHLHLYYPDLAQEFADYFENMPFPFDLLVSIVDEKFKTICENAFRGLQAMRGLDIRCLPNAGRDLGPMLCSFAKDILKYDYFGHFHSKKSPHDGRQKGWRKYVLNALLGESQDTKDFRSIRMF